MHLARRWVPTNSAGPVGHHGDVGVRSVFRWLASPRQVEERWVPGTYRCPRCGQQLPGVMSGRSTASALGPMWLPPTAEELVAQCPFDGHAPNNNPGKAMLASGALADTREDPPPG